MQLFTRLRVAAAALFLSLHRAILPPRRALQPVKAVVGSASQLVAVLADLAGEADVTIDRWRRARITHQQAHVALRAVTAEWAATVRDLARLEAETPPPLDTDDDTSF